MVVRYSVGLLDTVAPGMSEFRPVTIKRLEEQLDISRNWIFLVGLNEALGSLTYKAIARAAFRQFFRRTSAALEFYESMRKKLEEYSNEYVPDSPKFGKYFTALNSVEICILQIQMAAESLNKSVLRNLGDGRISGNHYETIFSIANNIKHFGERSQDGKVNANFPVWFVSEGVTDGRTTLNFNALFEVVEDLYQLSVDILSQTSAKGAP